MEWILPITWVVVGLGCALAVAIYAHVDPRKELGSFDSPADLMSLGFIMAGVAVAWPFFLILGGIGWAGLKIARKLKKVES